MGNKSISNRFVIGGAIFTLSALIFISLSGVLTPKIQFAGSSGEITAVDCAGDFLSSTYPDYRFIDSNLGFNLSTNITYNFYPNVTRSDGTTGHCPNNYLCVVETKTYSASKPSERVAKGCQPISCNSGTYSNSVNFVYNSGSGKLVSNVVVFEDPNDQCTGNANNSGYNFGYCTNPSIVYPLTNWADNKKLPLFNMSFAYKNCTELGMDCNNSNYTDSFGRNFSVGGCVAKPIVVPPIVPPVTPPSTTPSLLPNCTGTLMFTRTENKTVVTQTSSQLEVTTFNYYPATENGTCGANRLCSEKIYPNGTKENLACIPIRCDTFTDVSQVGEPKAAYIYEGTGYNRKLLYAAPNSACNKETFSRSKFVYYINSASCSSSGVNSPPESNGITFSRVNCTLNTYRCADNNLTIPTLTPSAKVYNVGGCF